METWRGWKGERGRKLVEGRGGCVPEGYVMDVHGLKGIGTRDLIWLKVVPLDRSW